MFRILDLVNRLLVALVVLLGVGAFALPLASSGDNLREEVFAVQLPKDEHERDFSVIGNGPFALREADSRFPLPGLKDEIVFLGMSQRPDGDGALIIGLNSSKMQMIVHEGAEYFLDYVDGGVQFCSEPKPLKVMPFFDGRCLRCLVSLDLPELSETVEWEFDETRWLHPPHNPQMKESLVGLKTAMILGPDQLLQLYGGESFSEEKEKFRFFSGDQKLLIGVGDDLVWQEGVWKRPDGETEGCFLARVLRISPERVQMEVWSPGGLDAQEVSLGVTKTAPLQLKLDGVFTRIRKRTRSCVSCLVDQKSRLLKRGDWLEKKKSGWKTLRSIDELEACVKGESEGELFVFDGVEKIGDQWMFLGHLFDERRSQVVAVQLPLSAKQKQPAKERRPMYDFDDDDDFFDDDDDDFLNALIPGGDFDD